MKKISLLSAIVLLFITFTINAQNNLYLQNINSINTIPQEQCSTSQIHERLMQQDPEYRAAYLKNQEQIRQIIQSGAANQTRSGTYTIPVVVHVMHLGEPVGTGTNISNAQIQSAINNLNACYSGQAPYSNNITIQFQLAARKYDCSATTGIVRVNASGTSDYATNGITTSGSDNEETIKALSKWPNSEYYNIWIVSEIDGNNGGAGTQGYAYYPGASSNVDGSVILYNAFGYDPTGALGYNLKNYTNRNVTTLHEIGHAFNLKHTFEGDGGGGSCPTNTSCSTQGDECCDTEAHRRGDGDCGATGTTCSGQNIANIVNNIMAYSSDVCQTVFTNDQKARMVATITGTRASLASSPGLIPVTGSAPSVAKSCSPQTTNLSNGFQRGIYGLTIGATTYSSSGAVADGGFRNNWCGNFNLTANTLYSITVTNGTLNTEKVKAYIDYNNDGDFEDAGENIFNGNTAGNSHSGSFTTSANPVTGQALWMRVISDASYNTISGPCYAPQYGQVEDFSVYFTPTGASQLIAAQCGQTFSDLTGFWNCNAVTNAQDYEFEFTNVGLGYSFTKTTGNANPFVLKTSITGLAFGNTYNVRVRAKLAGVWGSYGNVCTITLGSMPNSQLIPTHCGQTFSDLTGYFNCVQVLGATEYQFEFTNVGLGYSYTVSNGAPGPFILKSLITGLAYGNTYNVRVRARVGGSWGSFGNTCTVTLSGSTPTTQLIPTHCGQTFNDLTGYFNCVKVDGATEYGFEFTNVGLGYSYAVSNGAPGPFILKTQITGLLFGNTYNVRVRARVGGTWGSYGNTCTVTLGSIPTTQLIAQHCNQTFADATGYFNCIGVPGAQQYGFEFTNVGLGFSYITSNNSASPWIIKSAIVGLQNGVTYNVRVRANVGGTWGSYGNICTITINSGLGMIAQQSDTRTFEGAEMNTPELNVYPNPSSSNGFNVSYTVDELINPKTSIQVFDVLGKLQINREVNSIEGINEIKLNTDGNLLPGYYVIMVNIDNNLIKKNIIVQ